MVCEQTKLSREASTNKPEAFNPPPPPSSLVVLGLQNYLSSTPRPAVHTCPNDKKRHQNLCPAFVPATTFCTSENGKVACAGQRWQLWRRGGARKSDQRLGDARLRHVVPLLVTVLAGLTTGRSRQPPAPVRAVPRVFTAGTRWVQRPAVSQTMVCALDSRRRHQNTHR